ncbi:MAG: metal/formaldehyde-sensitive transcriptional repressor [Thalassolituus sp.]|uniref:metal/formaldehyde-sensitive transcriptional repressor n=1 Tax=Thalassolituus sp. TaxID=2030822 RepID=UPI0039821283
MAHIEQSKKKLLTRVRRIKGQAEALERVLENKASCMDVLQQIAAMRGAVNGLMTEVLNSHIEEHLGADDISPQQRKEEVADVMAILKSYLR